MTLRIDQVVTSGIFSLDGEDFNVDNNVWVLGDDTEALVIDAAHDAAAIGAAVGARTLLGIVLTHGHNDHIDAAGKLADATGAPLRLHPDDTMLWQVVHPDRSFEALSDATVLTVAGTEVQVLHTPGHSPGGVCLYVPDLGVLFSGDTLFHGGPGATGRSHSHFPTILDSIRERLLTLPPETRVLTGHGAETTIGAEATAYQDWVVRGH